MKKSKKIPKILPKYSFGAKTRTLSTGNVVSDAPIETDSTQNIYNTGRNNKINANQYAQYGQAALGLGTQLLANKQLQGEDKQYANSQSINNTVDSTLSSTTPWYTYAKMGSDMGRSMIKRDANGTPVDNSNKQLDAVMKPQHQMAIDDASKGNYGLAASEMLMPGIGYESRSNSLGLGKNINKMFNSNNDTNYQYAMGGVNQIPNAEIESQENVVAPNGGFLQANGPTHSEGGVPVNLPGNSLIFSDRLKMPGTKKTFANLNKSNNTNKEDKILNSDKHGDISKHTAELMKFAKNKNSKELFDVQEALKQAKVQAYAKKMGVTLPQQDNEQTEPQGMSEQSEGEYAYGGIHIKPSHVGRFTAYKERTGKTTEEALHSTDPHVRKMAQFAENASHWKHAMGGVHLPMYTNNQNELPQFPIGGLSPEQYKQAQADSTILYKSGLNPNIPNFQYPEYNNAYLRLNQLNNNPPVPLSGIQGYDAKFAKPSMIPYSNNVNNVQSNFQHYPVQHPNYSEAISGIPKSVPKFWRGGVKKPNTSKFIPKTAEYQEGDNVTIPNNSTKPESDFTGVLAPDRYNTFGKPLDSWDASRLNKSALENDYLNNPNAPKPTNTETKQFNWNGLTSNVAMGLANNAGNIYNLSRYNKPEVESYQRMQATYLDPSASIRDANEEARRAEYNVREASSGNAGTYLSNRVALNAQNTINKDRINKEYQNANAGISNSVGQYNNQLAQQEVIANAQNRARNRSGKGEAIGSTGYNIANQIMDNKKTNMDQETLGLMMKYYNDPQFKKYLEESGFNKKKTGE